MIDLNYGTLLPIATTATTCACDADSEVSDIACVTMTAVLTTGASTAAVDNGYIVVHAESARTYVSSMDDNELDDFIAQIDEKMDTLDSNVKVKSIGTMPGYKK